jgi:glycosyltransferase XagB
MAHDQRKEQRALRRQRRATAAVLLSPGQIALKVFLLIGTLAELRFLGLHATLQGIVAVLTVFYVLFVGLKLTLWVASTRYHFPELELPDTGDPDLPTYSVLIALKGEEKSVGRLIRAMGRLDYPTAKLEILLLVESFDLATQAAIKAVGLPSHFTMMLVPDAGPTTKPKALNWGWMHALGDIIAVYDAEDSPDKRQLLKAVARFALTAATNPQLACLQARLIFWNPRPKLISTMYFGEYLVHFNWVLRGLAKLKLVPPLGGTSNHFMAGALRDVARAKGTRIYHTEDGEQVKLDGPWDETNVTEDAALAMDLAEVGFRVDVLDSFTYEEAPIRLGKARNQRSRWLKGFGQTGAVHGRNPLRRARQAGIVSWLCFELMMLGTPFSLLMNPITWAMTTLYIVARWGLHLTSVTTYIHGLYSAPAFYAATAVAVLGNCLLFFQKLIAVVHQQEFAETSTEDVGALGEDLKKQMYGLVPRLLLTPAWWAFTSISAYQAVIELLRPSKRSAWQLSPHGHHADREEELELRAAASGIPLPEVEA